MKPKFHLLLFGLSSKFHSQELIILKIYCQTLNVSSSFNWYSNISSWYYWSL